MQTIEFIKTARWIIDQYTDATKLYLFEQQFREELLEPVRGDEKEGRRASEGFVNSVLNATHEMVLVAEKLRSHPHAPKILEAFGLNSLIEREYIITLAERVVAFRERNIESLHILDNTLGPLPHRWEIFVSSLNPVEVLTIPKEIAEEKDFDEVLTLEMKYEQRAGPPVETISKILANTTKLYESVAIALGFDEFDPLLVIYTASGSSFRFDFKGLGEPLKQVKELLVETWKKIRHRRADDFHHNSKAILEGLNLLSEIRVHYEQNVLDSETTVRLNKTIITSMLALFKEGALPREVQSVELVSNTKLMRGLQQRLLPAAPEAPAHAKAEKADGGKTKPKKRRKAARKKSVMAPREGPEDAE